MERYYCITTFVFVLNLYPFVSLCQKQMMKINDSLKTNSSFFEVKRKGFGVNAKSEFGPYKIISGKTGFYTAKSNSKLFSKVTATESKQQSSFVFVANEKDTVEVNISISSQSKSVTENHLTIEKKELKIEKESNTKEATNNFAAIISPLHDTADWQLVYFKRANVDSSSQQKEFKTLSNGQTEIQIKEVNESDNGKFSLLWIYHGYEFLLNGKVVAAIQTLSKQYVWLRNDLDEKMKLILAAAIAAIMFSYQ